MHSARGVEQTVVIAKDDPQDSEACMERNHTRKKTRNAGRKNNAGPEGEESCKEVAKVLQSVRQFFQDALHPSYVKALGAGSRT